MDDILARLCEVPGVLGAAIFVNGVCEAQRLSPPYEPIVLEEALTQLSHLGDALESIDGLSNRQSFFIRFQEGQFIVCQVGQLCLIVLADIKTQAAILSIGLNVALLKLERIDQTPFINAAQQMQMQQMQMQQMQMQQMQMQQMQPMPSMPQMAQPAPPPMLNSFGAMVPPNSVPSVGGRLSASVPSNSTPGIAPSPSMPRPSQPPPMPSYDAAMAVAMDNSPISMSSSHTGEMIPVATIRHVIRSFGDFFEGDAQATVRQTLQQKFGASPNTLPRSRYPYFIQELSALLPARSRKAFQDAVPQQ